MVNRRNYLSASLRSGASGEPRRDPVAASSPPGWKACPTKACATGVRAVFVSPVVDGLFLTGWKARPTKACATGVRPLPSSRKPDSQAMTAQLPLKI